MQTHKRNRAFQHITNNKLHMWQWRKKIKFNILGFCKVRISCYNIVYKTYFIGCMFMLQSFYTIKGKNFYRKLEV